MRYLSERRQIVRQLGLALGIVLFWRADAYAINAALVLLAVIYSGSLLIALLHKRAPLRTMMPDTLYGALVLQGALGLTYLRSLLLTSQLPEGTLLSNLSDLVLGSNLNLGFILVFVIVFLLARVGTVGYHIALACRRFLHDVIPAKMLDITADERAGKCTREEMVERQSRLDANSGLADLLYDLGMLINSKALWFKIMSVFWLVAGYTHHFILGTMTPQRWSTLVRVVMSEAIIFTVFILLASTAAGLFMRALVNEHELETLVDSFPRRAEVLATAGGMAVEAVALAGLGLPPGLSFGLQLLIKGSKQAEVAEAEEDTELKEPATPPACFPIDMLAIEIGCDLLPIADPRNQAPLLDLMEKVREGILTEFGFQIPKVQIRDNMELPPKSYQIRVREELVATGQVFPDRLMVLDSEEKLQRLKGIALKEPVAELPVVWIEEEHLSCAQDLGCAVFHAHQVIGSHLAQVVRENANELLSREHVLELLDLHREYCPEAGLVEPVMMTTVLRSLLEEQIPILEFNRLVQTISNNTGLTKDPQYLAEFARVELAREISEMAANSLKKIHVLVLDRDVEIDLGRGLKEALDFQWVERFQRALEFRFQILEEEGLRPILLVSPPIRKRVSSLARRVRKDALVMSWNEIAPTYEVNSLGEITLEERLKMAC